MSNAAAAACWGARPRACVEPLLSRYAFPCGAPATTHGYPSADCKLKICDFGLARGLENTESDDTSAPEFMPAVTPMRLTRELTKHVVTRWCVCDAHVHCLCGPPVRHMQTCMRHMTDRVGTARRS